jgi:A nuclease family of the HNH/ENDO VII superfamily with conserved AHH
LAAIGGGVSAGIGTLGDGNGLLSGKGLGATIGRAVLGNALTQGVAVLTGLQNSFDWRGVAASAVGAGVGYGVGQALSGVDINPYVARTVTSFAAGTAAALARGGKVGITQVAVDAFGNALGSSFGEQLGLGGQQEDVLGELIEQNQPAWNQRQANYDQVVGAFGSPTSYGSSRDVMLADAGGKLRLSRGTELDDEIQDARGVLNMLDSRAARRQAASAAYERQSAQAASNLYASGAGDVRDTSPPAFNDAEMASMRAENLARAQSIAAQSATGSYDGSMYETGIYSNNPGSIDYHRQRDGTYRIELSGLVDNMPATPGQLAQDFAAGAAHAVVGTVVQPGLQMLDMGLAATAVGYNELIRPFTGGQMWLPEMRSDVATSYAQGASQAKILASTLPVVNVGVFSYDTTTALMEGRNRDAARAAGGFMGGMAVGAGMQRYGSYGVQVGASGFGANGGNVRLSLVHPNLMGSGTKLAARMGGVEPGYQAHHLVMSDLAATSPALRYLAEKGLYDVNRAPNGRGYPGNPLSAADTGLPLHSGFHGKPYRDAVNTELRSLDAAFKSGMSDVALLAKVGRSENKLATRLESGRLWLNEADAMHRQLGNYAP